MLLAPTPCAGRASKVNPRRPRMECNGCALFAYTAESSLFEMAANGGCANRRSRGVVHPSDDASVLDVTKPLEAPLAGAFRPQSEG